ncbi:MAG: DMT family transporter [Enhydrobacter sp.]|nr:MAG: DMT family transporter [Enhydrobacter sp.]
MVARVWIWLVSLSVLWGGSFFFAKVALAELAPLTVVFGRVALAAIALQLARLLLREVGPRAAPWRAFLAMGLLNNVIPFALIFWGQTHIAAGLASILNATTPLFTLVVAHLLTHDEKMNVRKTVAALAGLLGVAMLIGPDALAGAVADVWGQIACLAAALSYAFAGVYGRRFAAMGVPPLDVAAGQVTASAMLILPIMLLVDQPWTLPVVPTAATLSALAALALLSTALAYLLYFHILAEAGATRLLLVTFLIPVTAILLGWLVLGERLEPRHGAGMTLIGGGMVLVGSRSSGRRPPAK